MKPRSLAFALLALALPLSAAPRQDYAQQWPLQLSRDDGGAYRVVLDPAVYAQAQSAQLRDIDVIDASGASVPS
ncbi:DUF3999 family protein, partial [Salinisphaera sp. USBA-960]|nr:DUF3999 family protein [Salifodinibacter halophilus]